jgi:hypothetical protein
MRYIARLGTLTSGTISAASLLSRWFPVAGASSWPGRQVLGLILTCSKRKLRDSSPVEARVRMLDFVLPDIGLNFFPLRFYSEWILDILLEAQDMHGSRNIGGSMSITPILTVIPIRT